MIYVSNGGNSTITVYAPSGGSPIQTISAGVTGPNGVALDAAGNIYVANNGNGTITKYANDGTQIVTGGFPFAAASAIAVCLDPSGNIYVGNHTGSVGKYSSAGAPLLTISAGVTAPNGIALDASGNIYVANYVGFAGSVTKYTSAGVQVTTGGFPITGGNISGPGGVALDSSGYIYVCEYSTSQISKYTSAGVEVTTGGFPITASLTNPNGICVDSAGNIYVGNTSTATVYSPSGSLTLTISTGVSSAVGIAVFGASHTPMLRAISQAAMRASSY